MQEHSEITQYLINKCYYILYLHMWKSWYSLLSCLFSPNSEVCGEGFCWYPQKKKKKHRNISPHVTCILGNATDKKANVSSHSLLPQLTKITQNALWGTEDWKKKLLRFSPTTDKKNIISLSKYLLFSLKNKIKEKGCFFIESLTCAIFLGAPMQMQKDPTVKPWLYSFLYILPAGHMPQWSN